MRILVTGGAGFIGSHLCRRLVHGGNRVICLDNFYTGSIRNVADLLDDQRFELLEHDVTEPIRVQGIQQIYNLACPASPVHYQHDPVKTAKTSVIGAVNVLELAKRNDAVVLQASTSEVYGDPLEHPQTETYWGNVNPIGERSCYDEGKRTAETLFFDYYRQFGIRIKVQRIFNTYGPNMQTDDGRVVSNFIINALSGKDIHVYGAGKQTRSFCYVDDQVEGMVRLMNSDPAITGPINIGNPYEEITMLELAERIIHMTGSASSVVFEELPKDDPKRRNPDITLARKLLGWEPKTNLEEGLKTTIAYFAKMKD